MKFLVKKIFKVNKSKLNIVGYNLLVKLMGKKITSYIFVQKYLKVYKNSDIIFIHIPKAAGTSITKEIYGKRNGHLSAKQIIDEMGKNEFINKFSFSVTRNPYDRLVSAYFYATQGGSKEGGITNPEKYKSYEFRNFKSFVKEWLCKQDLNKIDVIFMPQNIFIYNKKKCLVNEVYKLENIDRLIEILNNKLGKSVNLDQRNKSYRARNFMNYYDDETKEMVIKLYYKDFKLFGYQF